MSKQEVILCKELENDLTHAIGKCPHDKLFILTDEHTHRLCLPQLQSIPALENAAALAALDGWCAREGMLFAFDPFAYEVTSSKLRSRDLFLRCGTPIPQPAARADTRVFPIIAKPSEGSGSRGVRLLSDEAELRDSMPRDGFWNRTAPVRPFHWRYVEHPETTESFR